MIQEHGLQDRRFKLLGLKYKETTAAEESSSFVLGLGMLKEQLRHDDIDWSITRIMNLRLARSKSDGRGGGGVLRDMHLVTLHHGCFVILSFYIYIILSQGNTQNR